MALPMNEDPNAMPADVAALEGGSEDIAVLQIPKSQLDSMVQTLGALLEVVTAASQKAGSDIAAQKGTMAEKGAGDAAMIAELEAMSKGGQ